MSNAALVLSVVIVLANVDVGNSLRSRRAQAAYVHILGRQRCASLSTFSGPPLGPRARAHVSPLHTPAPDSPDTPDARLCARAPSPSLSSARAPHPACLERPAHRSRQVGRRSPWLIELVQLILRRCARTNVHINLRVQYRMLMSRARFSPSVPNYNSWFFFFSVTKSHNPPSRCSRARCFWCSVCFCSRLARAETESESSRRSRLSQEFASWPRGQSQALRRRSVRCRSRRCSRSRRLSERSHNCVKHLCALTNRLLSDALVLCTIHIKQYIHVLVRCTCTYAYVGYVSTSIVIDPARKFHFICSCLTRIHLIKW